ncbi:MAG TPA: hypothetical protein VE262_24575 [Blastocatellia bacterium]|nr:hypothetical protein [Blastocatellia bacterium]
MGELRIRQLIFSSVGTAVIFACMLMAQGCGGGESDDPLSAASAPLPPPPPRAKPSEPRPLINGQPSPEALAKRFLKYLSGNDAKAIQSLRLTRREFCEYVWPELPSSRIPNVTCDWAWDQATLKSDGGLSELLPRHAGRRYEVTLVRFAGGTEDHYTYRIHKDTRLVLKDESGEQREVSVLGSMLEMDGRYKLFSFREE